jgi:hypothetical protein
MKSQLRKGAGVGFGSSLVQSFPDRPQRRGERIGLGRELASGVGDQAVDFFVGQIEGTSVVFLAIHSILCE